MGSLQYIRRLSTRRAFTLVEIMVVVMIIALLAAIAIPNLMRAKMASNDALAKATLKAVSASSESYAIANNGNYPTDETSLTAATPPYQNKSYCSQIIAGYTYTCSLTSTMYTITATPVAVDSSGTTTYNHSNRGRVNTIRNPQNKPKISAVFNMHRVYLLGFPL